MAREFCEESDSAAGITAVIIRPSYSTPGRCWFPLGLAMPCVCFVRPLEGTGPFLDDRSKRAFPRPTAGPLGCPAFFVMGPDFGLHNGTALSTKSVS